MVTRWSTVSRRWLQLEFNPFSTASRAARAERAGRIGRALSLYAQAGQRTELLGCLRDSLPDWPIRTLLMDAAAEFLQLKASVAIANDSGIPASMVNRLSSQASDSAAVLWRSAGTVAAAARLKADTATPLDGLARESQKLDQMLQAIREARNGLAELVLAGGDIGRVERDFRTLAAAATGLREALDEAEA